MEGEKNQRFFELQRELSLLNESIQELITKIWNDIKFRSNKENLNLLQNKLSLGPSVTKIEFLDKVLNEYIELWNLKSDSGEQKIEEYRQEARALRKQNHILKTELRRSQLHSEELDRQNESLGGSGLNCSTLGSKYNLTGEDHVNEQVLSLQTELRLARQEIDLIKQKDLVHKEAQPTAAIRKIMTDNTQIFKRIQGLVPIFSGEISDGLHTEVDKFCDGISLAIAGIADKTEFLKLVKQRMQGDAYQLVRLMHFSDEKELIKLIRNTYLKPKSLDSVTREIHEASQRPNEDLRQYARRLQNLTNMAEAIISENYSGSTDTIIKQELAKKVKFAFVAGLREQMLRSRLLSSQADNLNGLLEEALVAQAILWRGEEPPQAKVCFASQQNNEEDTVTGLVAAVQQLVRVSENNNRQTDNSRRMPARYPPCMFCSKQSHSTENCWERQKMSYCNKCNVYGHDRGRLCQQGNVNGVERGYNQHSNMINGRSNAMRERVNWNNDNTRGYNQSHVQTNINPSRDNRIPQINYNPFREYQGHQRDNRNPFLNQNGQVHTTQNQYSPSTSRPRNAQGARNASMDSVHCYACGVLGHIKRNCPQHRVSGNQ